MNKSRGFSLVEIIIAVAILVIVGAGVAYFLTGSQKTALKITKSSSCESAAQNLLADFAEDDSKLHVINYLVLPTPAPERKTVELFNNSSRQIKTFQNIEGAVTRAYQIYLNSPDVCVSALT